MSLPLLFHPTISFPKTHLRLSNSIPTRPISSPQSKVLSVKSLQRAHEQPPPKKPRWENLLSTAASLYPVYVTAGSVLACAKPSAFSWFVSRGPTAYTLSLAFVMLVMGLTLELKDLFRLLMERPLSILFGCVAQYTIMPAFGAIVSKSLGLSPSLSVGLILLACCPGGTASNVVTLIARGDVPLSIVMTACTTLSAVVFTPMLTKVLAGAYVPVDAVKLSVSTLQVVVAPILLGSFMQSRFPSLVKMITPFAPLLAVLAASLLASSIFSENVVLLKSSILSPSAGSGSGPLFGLQGILSGELGIVILSVLLLHFAGFFVGYLSATVCGFKEPQRRAISIEMNVWKQNISKDPQSAWSKKNYMDEVGMQNSVLGVVLATSHFSSPLVALPPAMSAVVMNIMGSSLAFIWRYINPSDDKNELESKII